MNRPTTHAEIVMDSSCILLKNLVTYCRYQTNAPPDVSQR
jgi:hypothetical protein